MSVLLKLEELAQVLLGIFVFSLYPMEWWWFLIFFFLPDLSMLAYLLGNRPGAVSYNLAHHKGLAVLLFLLGYFLDVPWLEISGIILFSHAAFDRMLGYGLKHYQGFGYTHLGRIGRIGRKVSS